jgi:two-component sensor histidine kinase
MRWQALTCFWLLVSFGATGQQLARTSPRELRVQLKAAKVDSIRMWLLIQLSSRSHEAHRSDSAIYYAQQAQGLSTALHSERGYATATALICRALLFQEDLPAATAVLREAKGVLRVRLLIVFGEHYLFKPGELRVNLDKAEPYLRQAHALSAALGSTYWRNESLGALAKYSFARGDLEQGKRYAMTMINAYQRAGDKKNEAIWWVELGIYLPATDSTYAEGIASYQRGLALYRQLHNKEKEAETLDDLANKYYQYGRLALAEKVFLQALAMRKSLKITKTYPILYHLSSINRSRGNLNRALWYALECVKNMELLDEKVEAILMYSNLADVYRDLGQTEKSVTWYRLALQHDQGRADFYYYAIGSSLVHGLINLGESAQALRFLNNFIRQHPPVRFNDQEIMEAALGDCYAAIGRDAQAERHYLAMIKLDAQERRNKIKEIRTGHSLTGSPAYAIMAQFYASRSRFEQARYYAQQALAFNQDDLPLSRRRDLEKILFRVELAAQNTLAATRHFELFETLNDSLFSIAKSRQIEELQIQYETAKQEQAFALLRNQGQLQQQELRQSIQLRNFSYAGIGLLLLLLGLGYNRYRFKQRSNRLLEAQQAEINSKNVALERVLGEKEGLLYAQDTLLEEKEWLLKEVHHRVKNNLQIIISLLRSQSKYLLDEAAINAIEQSQYRVRAMALIHQKLYRSGNLARIDMPAYIQEVVQHLSASFDPDGRVTFRFHLAPLELDVAQAVPLGLILNEAITNALKYAFPPAYGHAGTVDVSLSKLDEEHCLLVVQDDGVGLPTDVDLRRNKSMGANIMRGLSKQLGGALHVDGHRGVTISVPFTLTTSAPQFAPAT